MNPVTLNEVAEKVLFPLPVIRERVRVRGNLSAAHRNITPAKSPLTLALSRITGRGNKKAFTLIELLLVLVILAVLAAIVIPKFTGYSKQARETAAKTQIESFKTSLDTFEIDAGRYPTSEEGLNALFTAPSGLDGLHEPYMPSIPKDPWGNPYQYKQPGTHNPTGYDIYSLGIDGREGNDDIGNWTDTK